MNAIPDVVTEPSIGQVEYLKELQCMEGEETPDYVMVNMEMKELYLEIVEKTISFFVRRHESIRTIFPLMDGEVKQVVLPADDSRFVIEYIDVSVSRRPFVEIKEECFNRAAVIFSNIQKGPLVKFFVFKHDGAYSFCLLIHHILCDGWSRELIKRELSMFYNCFASGRIPDIAPLKVQLRDYCMNQNEWLRRNKEKLNQFWNDKLSGFDRLFDIGSFYKGYSLRSNTELSQTSMARDEITQNELFRIYGHPTSVSYAFIVSDKHFNNIRKLAANNKCTISAVVYASFYIFLYCYTGKRRILLAALIADRFTPEHQLLIGCLLGGVYFPREITENAIIRDFIIETLRDVFANCRNIIPSHEYLDLDPVKLQVSCDIYVNYQHQKNTLLPATHSDRKYAEIPRICYPIDCAVSEYVNGLHFIWKYNALLFDKALIEDMAKCYEEILDFITINDDKTIEEVSRYIKRESRKVS